MNRREFLGAAAGAPAVTAARSRPASAEPKLAQSAPARVEVAAYYRRSRALSRTAPPSETGVGDIELHDHIFLELEATSVP
jgi:hypothetical protein